MSDLTEKNIRELFEYNFFIPAYQRGYRWTDREVQDLLNDIWGFINKPEKKESEWYCLQPVVVKKINDGKHEVLDGQQRLTTIFLILKHLEKFIKSERKCFTIEYETRNTESSNSLEFLQNIESKSDSDSKTNIDYFHIYKAFEKIKEWFGDLPKKIEYIKFEEIKKILINVNIENKNYLEKFYKSNNNDPYKLENNINSEDKERISEILNSVGYIHKNIEKEFIKSFLENTKVIWYEVDSNKDAIEIFTRINMGKIPLTNAELIKALFLNSSNFKNSDKEDIRLRQLEIASEWDRIEYSLQNDELWYFLNNSDNSLPTRIEYIFNLIKDIDGVNNGNNQYSTFRYFSDKFISKDKDYINKNWKEIKTTFQIIEEWFSDRELYHKIGYLIATGVKITELIKEIKENNVRKSMFINRLNERIEKIIECDNLEDLEYGKDNELIKKILLFHNIYLTLNSKNELLRFPFYKYKDKKNGWSIEHIHAQNSKEITEYEDFKSWYNEIDNDLKNYIPEELKSKIESIEIKKEDINLGELVSEISDLFGDVDIHSLDNLTLLSKNDNSSLNNSIFPLKRKKIIDLEKKGSFIPIATRNIFQKYYDGCTKQLIKWEDGDRNAYIEDIKIAIEWIKGGGNAN